MAHKKLFFALSKTWSLKETPGVTNSVTPLLTIFLVSLDPLIDHKQQHADQIEPIWADRFQRMMRKTR